MKRILWNTLHNSLRPLSAIGVVAAMALLVSSVVAQPTEPEPITTTVVETPLGPDGERHLIVDDADLGVTSGNWFPLHLSSGVGTKAVDLADRPVMFAQADATSADEALPAPIKPGEEVKTVVASVTELQGFAATGQWGLFASGILTFLLLLLSTGLARSEGFRKWIQPYVGYLAIALPMIGCLIVEFASIPAGAGAGDWGSALWAGAQVGGNSIVIYEIIWKKWIRPLARKLWAWIKRKKADAE